MKTHPRAKLGLAGRRELVRLIEEEDLSQREVAMRFAGQIDLGGDKFGPYRWSRLSTGAPALDGAMVNLDCTIASATETESHSIFIGNVQAVRFGASSTPLLHYNRHFFSLAQQTAL